MFIKKAGWNKFELFRILGGRGSSQSMTGIVYKICVRSTVCYEVERWAMKVENINRLETTETRILLMTCRTLKGKTRNECIREKTGVEKYYVSCAKPTTEVVWGTQKE